MIQFPLDFARDQSVTVRTKREASMDRDTLERTITTLLAEIYSRLSEATRIAKAAEACANAGSITEGFRGLNGYRATDLRGRAAP